MSADVGARDSPVHGRVVFVVGGPGSGAERVAAALGALPGLAYCPAPTDLGRAGAGLRLVGYDMGSADAGVAASGAAALAGPSEFLSAARELADVPFAALLARTGARRVVEYSDEHAWLIGYLARLYPDATYLAVVRSRDAVLATLSATGSLTAATRAGYERDAAALVTARSAGHPPLLRDVDVDALTADPDAAATLARLVGEPAPGPRVAAAVSRRLAGDPALPIDPPDPTTPFDPLASPLAGRLVVILGAPRSGTTWLHRLLSAHPRIAGTATGETWLFRPGAAAWRRHRVGSGLAPWIGEAALLDSERRFCDRLFTAFRDRDKPAASHVVEKTPAHVWDLDFLARLYPDASYVHILRDGRDVALSLRRIDGAFPSLAAAAEQWAASVAAVRSHAENLPRFVELRYEDLLADSLGALAPLWRWLGLPDDAEARANATVLITERVSPLPSQGRVGAGKWRDLEPAALAEIEGVAGPTLRRCGYPLARARVHLPGSRP